MISAAVEYFYDFYSNNIKKSSQPETIIGTSPMTVQLLKSGEIGSIEAFESGADFTDADAKAIN